MEDNGYWRAYWRKRTDATIERQKVLDNNEKTEPLV